MRSDPVRADAWGSPAFVDGFDGVALGPAWEHRIQFHNPWGGRACSKGDPSAVVVGGGTVRLSVLPDPALAGETCASYDAHGRPTGTHTYRLNGHISTQSAFDFQYGVAAARIRFQRQPRPARRLLDAAARAARDRADPVGRRDRRRRVVRRRPRPRADVDARCTATPTAATS